MGIDLAPTYIRFDRAEKQIRKASNVEFYQANAEDMFFIESNSVDFINYFWFAKKTRFSILQYFTKHIATCIVFIYASS